MERIKEYLAERGATLVDATPVAGNDRALAGVATEAITSADARSVLCALADAVSEERDTISMSPTEGADRRGPAYRTARDLAQLGYLGRLRIDPSTGLLHASIRALSDKQRDRVRRLAVKNHWLEVAAAGQVASSAGVAQVDVEIVVNARVVFGDGVCREIDVLAVGPDAVVAIEAKSGKSLNGTSCRYADVVQRLGLARSQGILLAPCIGERAVSDLARAHAVTVSEGPNVEAVITEALTTPVRGSTTPQPTPAEVEAAAVHILASAREPVTLAGLIRAVRDELSTTRPLVQRHILKLGSLGRLLGVDGSAVAHFQDVVGRIATEARPALGPLQNPDPMDTSPRDDARGDDDLDALRGDPRSSRCSTTN